MYGDIKRASSRRQSYMRLTLILLSLLLLACTPHPRRTVGQSLGAESEVLLVMDRAVRQSDLLDTLDRLLTAPVPVLNQAEPFFRLTHLSTADYTGRYTLLHTVVRVGLDAHAKAPTLSVGRDQTARPQIVVQVIAPTLAALRRFLPAHADTLRDILLDHQLDVRAAALTRRSEPAARAMQTLFGRSVALPPELHFVKRGHDALWVSDRMPERSLNFAAYLLPPCESDTLFAHLRDSVMRRLIPGTTPQQWMATARLDGRPLVALRTRDGYTEARGLWEMHEGAMGGPFVAYIRRDTLRRRLLVVEGFVYSPSTPKRDLLRRIEATLRTVK